MHLGPFRLFHLQPLAIGLEPPLEHPVRFVLLLRDEADDVLVQALGGLVHLDIGLEAVFVFFAKLLDGLDRVFVCHVLMFRHAAFRRASWRPKLFRKRSMSSCVFAGPRETRRARRARSPFTPMPFRARETSALPE